MPLLNDNAGMLFIFQKPTKNIAMWMKNTLLSLDILFIDKQKKIVKIVRNAKPKTTKLFSPPSPVKWVLEVKGGTSQKNNIHVNDRIILKQTF